VRVEPAALPVERATRVSALSPRAWWTAVLYITAAAIFLRFYDLPLKPLHHDEAVNTLFLTSLVRPPHPYKYDPSNYHGPTLYYVAWGSTLLFGVTTVAIRVVTALTGLLAVLLLFCLRRQIGAVGALTAAALLCLSPGAVYFSRYFIHETLLVAATLAAAVAAVTWLSRGGGLYALLAAAAAGFMFATKETAVITAVVLIGATFAAAWLPDLRGASWKRGATGRLVDRLPALTASWRNVRAARPRSSAGGLFLLISCVGVFVVLNLVFYTSLFTHWQGAIDAVKALAIWTKTGTTDHVRSWDTYVSWLAQQELPLLLLGAAGTVAALWRAENRFAVFAGVWSIGVLAAYSVIPYKTPWLTLNIIVPLAISSGYACELIWRHRRALPRAIPLTIGAAIAGLAGYQTIVLNFARYDDGRYPYVYAHTYRDVLSLVSEIHRLKTSNPDITIAVTSSDQFPLSWYLRDYPVGYYGRPIVTGDALVIASDEQKPTLDVSLGDRYEQFGAYRLRPGVTLLLYARRDLRR
jgi:uncharacterized protein (TIGR03663 family)